MSPNSSILSEIGAGLEPVARSTSINVQHRLVASGTGIGALPRFIGDHDAGLRAVLPEAIELRRSFWLVTHSDVRRLARIEAVAKWLRVCAGRLI